MMRVQTFPCSLAKVEADTLNRESGRHYTNVLVWHYRIYRRTGHWLSEYAAKRLEDELGGPTILHAHSRDAAQEGFYAACKIAKSQQRMGAGHGASGSLGFGRARSRHPLGHAECHIAWYTAAREAPSGVPSGRPA